MGLSFDFFTIIFTESRAFAYSSGEIFGKFLLPFILQFNFIGTKMVGKDTRYISTL
jgi:hypothetical protein